MAALLGLAVMGDGQAAQPELVSSGTPHEALFDVAFDGQHGFAVGMPMLLMETVDGGASWTRQHMPNFMGAILGVSTRGQNTVAVGQYGFIGCRESGGAWRKADSGSEERLLSSAVNAAGQSVVVGTFGTILHSADGCAGWSRVGPDDWEPILNDFVEPHVNDVVLEDNGVGYLVGEFGLVMRTEDGGANWTVERTGDEALFGVHVDAKGAVWAVGQSGTVLRRSPASGTWRKVKTNRQHNLLDIASNANGDLLVSGIRTLFVIDTANASIRDITNEDIKTNWYQGVAVPGGAAGQTHIFVGHRARIMAHKSK